eukprot:3092064-Rhodomonas_salina.1
MNLSGASIKVSQKGDVVPGTTNRIVTIIGNPVASNYAHMVSAVLSAVCSVASWLVCFLCASWCADSVGWQLVLQKVPTATTVQ